MFKLNHLPHQQKGEEVVFVLRRSDYVLFRLVGWYGLLLLLPLLLDIARKFWLPNFNPTGPHLNLLILLIFAYYLYIILFFYRSWLDYYLDVWIVTTHRILSIELEGLFNRVVSEQKLFRIQDVTTEQKGFWANFFQFGDVFIQTAGPKARFNFEQVSNPEKVAQRVVQLIEWNKKAFPGQQE